MCKYFFSRNFIMTHFKRNDSGEIVVHGVTHHKLIGSRAEVWHKTAYKTTGGLTRSHLIKNKSGRIVSRKKHGSAKRDKRLILAGYGTKKGTFGWVKLNKTKKKRT